MTRILFAALLMLATAAALLAPQWSRAQSALGYYHDLVTRLQGPVAVLPAGSTVTLDADLINLGPDPSPAPRLLLSTGDAASLVGTGGCLGSPFPVPACQLAAPLPAASKADVQFIVRINPAARDAVVLGVTAIADGIDTRPENDVSLAVIALETRVSLAASLLTRDTFPDGRQTLLLRIGNTGPSTTERLRVAWQATSGAVPVTAQCSALGSAACPQGDGDGRLPPDGDLLYAFAFPPLSTETPAMGLDLQATALDAREDGAVGRLSVAWSDPISGDGFE